MEQKNVVDHERFIIETIRKIVPADQEALQSAAARQDNLAKPPGSLGGLEDMAVRVAGITGKVVPDAGFPERGCVLVFCADNGVVAQGVASAPQSVTRAQTINFTRGLTGVGALAKSFESDVMVVDMGVKDPIPREFYTEAPEKFIGRIIDRRIRPETWDISQGPAMTEEEALQAMASGAEMARAAVRAGYNILGVGEMGIGNTTTSAAVLSCITGAGADETCGRGGGLNDKGFQRKKEIVGGILQEFRETADREPGLSRIIGILARCGGFDLAAMTGAYLGATAERVPVVIDGYISVVAALAAAEICPAAADCMFASHISAEPGYVIAMDRLSGYSPGLSPFLALDMRLGEGSGCPIVFRVIQGACDVMKNMATFEEAAINDDYLEEVRAGGCF